MSLLDYRLRLIAYKLSPLRPNETPDMRVARVKSAVKDIKQVLRTIND